MTSTINFTVSNNNYVIYGLILSLPVRNMVIPPCELSIYSNSKLLKLSPNIYIIFIKFILEVNLNYVNILRDKMNININVKLD